MHHDNPPWDQVWGQIERLAVSDSRFGIFRSLSPEEVDTVSQDNTLETSQSARSRTCVFSGHSLYSYKSLPLSIYFSVEDHARKSTWLLQAEVVTKTR